MYIVHINCNLPFSTIQRVSKLQDYAVEDLYNFWCLTMPREGWYQMGSIANFVPVANVHVKSDCETIMQW